ncbi:MAG: iron-sulfur cluster assembly accessory protein [Candidatus Eisenbacteria bacterium]
MVTLSDLASRKLSEIIAAQGEKVYGLRVHAMAGCCSGPSFGMSLAAEVMPGDWEGEFSGVRLIVDPESAGLLDGATIDYVETPEASGFTIQNPKAVAAGGGCGCGSGHSHAQGGAEEAKQGNGHGGCGCGSH